MNALSTLKELLKYIDIYNIITALRGPDVINDSLKIVFSGRIRAILGIEHADVAVRPFRCLYKHDVANILTWEKLTCIEHYLAHVYNALGSLIKMISNSELVEELDLLAELAYMLMRLIHLDIRQNLRIRVDAENYIGVINAIIEIVNKIGLCEEEEEEEELEEEEIE